MTRVPFKYTCVLTEIHLLNRSKSSFRSSSDQTGETLEVNATLLSHEAVSVYAVHVKPRVHLPN